MEIEVVDSPQSYRKKHWQDLLSRCGLVPDTDPDRTVLIWDDDHLIAAGSRQDNILKYIAVDADHQGEGLTATLLTHLRQDAFSHGLSHLFLYTKPKNHTQFSSLFFYPIAQTDQVLLMENRRDGIHSFLFSLPVAAAGDTVGALVMNCNPFTLGHRHLIETAARECSHVYVFVLSEDKSRFSAKDRLAMVQAGTADLPNVTVLPTGPYLISSATFPTYFLKDREQANQIQCLLDIEIFIRYYVPKFSITHRYVGTEPLSPMTDRYNHALRTHLPQHGIHLREIPRLEKQNTPISASAVRELLDRGNTDEILQLVPESTIRYLKHHNLVETGG